MPKLFFVILTLSFFSCKGNHSSIANHNFDNTNSTVTTLNKPVQQNETVSWIDSFRKLRSAIYQGNKSMVKTFVDFPIMNEHNDIWYLAFLGHENQLGKLPDSIKPFSEQDFDKYFNKIFTKRFINSILKIKTAELAKKGQTETIELSEGESTIYHMTATYDKSNKILELNLSSKTFYKNDDDGEFSILYLFKVFQNGQIKFLKVRLAG